MKYKRTKWFPAQIKPVHVGWYETNQPDIKEFKKSKYRWWWDGKEWTMKLNDGDNYNYHLAKPEQNRVWRGLQQPTVVV
jgi:hypothetical protein